jgi:membrane associated rhomboid family serine protease
VLIPYGLEDVRLRRLPWATLAIVALSVACFAAQGAWSTSAEVKASARALATYVSQHPDLPIPPELAERAHLDEEALQALRTSGRHAPPGTGSPARLAELVTAMAEALEARPELAWGLVPARGLVQPGWITYQFLHGDLGHLLGNMLIFVLVVAPFLEEAWGSLFFVGLFLVGGVVAGAAQALPEPDSHIPIIGASGAISACLGAFALRFAHRRVRILYWFFLFFRGSFFVPAWGYAFFGFALDLWALSAGSAHGVAYGAHVGGFLFGVAVALVIRARGLEERLAPEGVGRWGATLDASRGAEALAAGDPHEARRHLEAAVSRRGDDTASLLALARLEAGRFDRARVTALVEQLLRVHLAAGRHVEARAALAELGPWLEPDRLEPASAFRAAELLATADPGLADQLDESAARRGADGLAAKALIRQALRHRVRRPDHARDQLERAVTLAGAPAELRARAETLLAALPPRAPPVDRSIALDDVEGELELGP